MMTWVVPVYRVLKYARWSSSRHLVVKSSIHRSPSISFGHISSNSSLEVAKPRSLLSVTTLRGSVHLDIASALHLLQDTLEIEEPNTNSVRTLNLILDSILFAVSAFSQLSGLWTRIPLIFLVILSCNFNYFVCTNKLCNKICMTLSLSPLVEVNQAIL